ncbi:YDG domain-containing protein [uncultured Selenomonas sp.]|uniref:YDG domain-containing protein n=1 Tax=uncultured Selenomonas sp. TaxID=159275 RepID=UPI0025F5DDAA|nr:YDG domain-containing protein [uncultured Selenomonas sp.]
MKQYHAKQLYRAVACAIFAGIVAAPFAAQTAYALPIEGANAATNAGEANISTSGTVMDITGKTEHNILKWEDFSIEQNEKVRFDGGSQTRDYLNLVTGEGASNIYGTIEGGRSVYLVNPHGILFAAGSQVNTGALYLSTANPADIATATNTFKTNGTSPLSAATAQTGDVLNLGTVKASKLYIEGKNVKVLNTDAVTDANGAALTGSAVTIRSEDAPHIGYDVANTTTRNFTVNGSTVPKTVSDYANANNSKSATSRTWDVKKLNGTDAHTDYDYMRVHDVYELQNMNAKLDGRYMLAKDIAASETKDWTEGFQPIGDMVGSFWGRFDGARHTITGLTIKPLDDIPGEFSRGMFAYIDHALVENVSLKGASVSGTERVGGIVGFAEESAIRNVSFSGEVHGGNSKFTVGGIAGTIDHSTLENAYNEGTVEGNKTVGGIVGSVYSHSTVQNVRNAGKVLGNAEFLGGIAGALKESTLENAYNEGTVEGKKTVGGIAGLVESDSSVQNVRNAGKVLGNEILGGIAGWVESDSSVRNAVQTGDVEQRAGQTDSKVGGVAGLLHRSTLSHAVWKEGSVKAGSGTLIQRGVGKEQGNFTKSDVKEHSLDDMKKAETYKDWKDGSDKALVATEGGKGTPWRIYDGKTMPLLTSLMKGTKRLAKVYDGNVFATTDPHITLVHTGKDVGTYDAYSDQFGYDLIGGATITQRVLTMGDVAAQSKTYDGTTSADASKFSATLGNLVAGEENSVKATATGAAYNDKNVAAANTVNYTGVHLTGTGAGNYSIASTAQGAGTITKRALTVGTVTAQSKIYDGTTAADTSKFQATLGNVVAGEESSVTATAAGAAYNDKNVAAANKVGYTGLALQGTGAGNYTIANTAEGAGTITKRALTLAAAAGQTFDKVYDGTTHADAAALKKGGNYTLSNFADGEGAGITLTGTGTYMDKNVGTHAVTYTGLMLTGEGAGNYRLNTATLTGTGKITHRTLTLTADARSIVQGEPLPSFTGRAEGFADGEDGSVFGADGVTFTTAVADTNTPGSYAIIGKAGGVTDGVLGNYRIVQAAGNATAFTVNAAALPGGLLASLVQDAAPRFDFGFGFGDTVYLYGTARPIRAAALGFYRFDAERDLEIQGLRL